MLSKRLACVLSMVPARAQCVLDVGCDHGYLALALLQQGICGRVIASDVSAGALEKARRHKRETAPSAALSLRLGDGFAVLAPGEADVAVIAGMGGRVIAGILQAGGETPRGMKALVLQPMSDAETLRAYLRTHGWRVVREQLVRDAGRIYPVLRAQRGSEQSPGGVFDELGWQLVRARDPLLAPLLEKRLRDMNRALTQLEAGTPLAHLERIAQVAGRIAAYEEVLAWLAR
nr:class I SAM-dependent methyltransferase [Maliibacterium massiliense]